MIFFAKDRVQDVKIKPQNGEGEIQGQYPFASQAKPQDTCFQMIAEMTLPVRSTVGFHRHNDDEEIYIIVSGQGLFTDNDGSVHPVGPGDTTLTRRGEGHSLANTGQEPLVFTAVIVA